MGWGERGEVNRLELLYLCLSPITSYIDTTGVRLTTTAASPFQQDYSHDSRSAPIVVESDEEVQEVNTFEG